MILKKRELYYLIYPLWAILCLMISRFYGYNEPDGNVAMEALFIAFNTFIIGLLPISILLLLLIKSTFAKIVGITLIILSGIYVLAYLLY